MQFIKVDDVQEANFWVAEEDDREERQFLRDYITPGKAYQIIVDKKTAIDYSGEEYDDSRYSIVDDSGGMGELYIGWNGHFVKYIEGDINS